ncbi:MAG: ATP-binding protein [archaeon YNP-LCB-024-027]|nr:ATP-binding protein [Candidatus Culexarchaeum yellowstonense]
MVSIIRFSDLDRWRSVGRWVLVYGRRKVGKSFFIRNNVKWDKYYFIGRSGSIFIDDETISYDAFRRELIKGLENDETIVVDEFQRLPKEFLDVLHGMGVKGKLIAVTSTLWLSKEIFEASSPLLGLFSDFKMGIIDEMDILQNMQKYIKDSRKLLEYSIFLREPWLIPLWEASEEFSESLPYTIRLTVPSLIGEIFTEEERSYSRVYDAILKAVADGKMLSTEITSQLYSLKLIPAESPSFVHPYLKILEHIGLLEKVKIYGKNKYYYYHASPVTDYYYYLDAKYGISERDVQPSQARKVLELKIPHYVERFLSKLLSKIFGLWAEKIVERDFEVDIALTDFRQLKIVVEVKWGDISGIELSKIEDKLSRFNCRRILFLPNADMLPRTPEKLEVWDVKRILNLKSLFDG